LDTISFYLVTPEKEESESDIHSVVKLRQSYYPRSLKCIFEAKLSELKPALKNKADEQKLLYSLERLCKNFLMVLLKEKPERINLGTMNLHNFGRAIEEIYEFNKTLDTSIEQLYINRKKLDTTVNKLLDFILHIDTEQYGYDFPAAQEVTHLTKTEKRKASFEQKEPTIHKEKAKLEPAHKLKMSNSRDYSNMVINSSRSNGKSQISGMSSVAVNKQSKASNLFL